MPTVCADIKTLDINDFDAALKVYYKCFPGNPDCLAEYTFDRNIRQGQALGAFVHGHLIGWTNYCQPLKQTFELLELVNIYLDYAWKDNKADLVHYAKELASRHGGSPIAVQHNALSEATTVEFKIGACNAGALNGTTLLPEYRGQGIGSQLIDAVLDHMPSTVYVTARGDVSPRIFLSREFRALYTLGPIDKLGTCETFFVRPESRLTALLSAT